MTDYRAALRLRGLVEAPEPAEGTLAPRASGASDARAVSLDGTWRISVFDSLPGAAGADENSAWTDIAVPGHWTLQGHGAPWYTNIPYPIPVDPPLVPSANPTAVYEREFDLELGDTVDDGTWVLRFEGIESIGIVQLNGRHLGVTRGSRLEHDFNATDALVRGSNCLRVTVAQWSAQTYLEDQDMWWLPGIFRSVHLLHRPAGELGDLFVKADYDHTTGAGSLLIATELEGQVSCAELGLDGARTGMTHQLPRVEPWSAETPRLYELIVENANERRTVRVGFRRVLVRDGLLEVNGRPLAIRGVNRHEFDPRTGRALDRSTHELDVRLMKQHNINAVRTSHYPPSSAFLDLCDEFGLWVIDECDLETHGFVLEGWATNPSDDPTWQACYVDRMRRMIERDKNHPSVILWSLGNESHTGRNTAAMAEFAHRRDPSRPVHYADDNAGQYVDVLGQMYVPFARVDEIGRVVDRIDEAAPIDSAADVARRRLPYLLTEYAHAMGNGPGGLLDYRALFERYPRLQGGFVWEWIDQGIERALPGGQLAYLDGRDFGQALNDGVFVIDGLVRPDRSASPGLVDFKYVFQPVRFERTNSELRIKNLRTFTSLDDLEFHFEILKDGRLAHSTSLRVPHLDPGAFVDISVPCWAVDATSEWTTRVVAVLLADSIWAPAGHEVAFAEWTAPVKSLAPLASRSGLNTAPSRVVLDTASFDGDSGDLLALGDVVFDQSPRVDLWRAPTSNDIGLVPSEGSAAAWRRAGLELLDHSTRSVYVGLHELVVEGRVAPLGQQWGVRTRWHWQSTANGLDLDLAIEPYGPTPKTWPLVGIRFALPAAFDRVEWFGSGPGESYGDSHSGVRTGRYSRSVLELQTPYLIPQENGRRAALRELQIFSDSATLRLAGNGDLGFSVRPWTPEHLQTTHHLHELQAGEQTVVVVDAGQDGLGSASCGPLPLPKDRLVPSPKRIRTRFIAAS